MANPISLPPEIVLGITTIKASGIDPNDFNNAVQELYNRGYGKAGKWIQDNKDLYLQALQDGYVPEGTQVPNSEIPNAVPPTPSGYETGTMYPPIHQAPANDPEDSGIAPEAPVSQEAPTSEGEPDELADKPHKRK